MPAKLCTAACTHTRHQTHETPRVAVSPCPHQGLDRAMTSFVHNIYTFKKKQTCRIRLFKHTNIKAVSCFALLKSFSHRLGSRLTG